MAYRFRILCSRAVYRSKISQGGGESSELLRAKRLGARTSDGSTGGRIDGYVRGSISLVVACSSDWFVVVAVWVWIGIEVRDDLDLLVLDCMLAVGYMD